MVRLAMIYHNIIQKFNSYTNKITFILVCLLVILLIVDTSVIKIYYFSFSQSPVSWRVDLFIIISIMCLVSLFLILQIMKQRSKHLRIRKSLHFDILHQVVTISQYLLAACIIFINLQVVISSGYITILLTIVTWISYITAITMLVVLAQKFFAWFKSDKNITVLIYAISSAVLAINAAFIIAFVTTILMNVPDYVQPHIGVGSPFFTLGPATGILNGGYVISSIISFMLWWVATTLVLRSYYEKTSRRYWFALVIPLVYFLIQFPPLFLSLFSAFNASQPILFSIIYTLVFTVTKPVGAILFGITFWIISRKISGNNVARNYMIISAYGLVLVFVSNQVAVLVSAPYPPFGLATTLFMGLASYLLLIGIYSSAISVAEDSKLRQTIRRLAVRETKFLDSIGTAQMQDELQRRVLRLVKEQRANLTLDTGVEPSLNEPEFKQYLYEVIEEIKRSSVRH